MSLQRHVAITRLLLLLCDSGLLPRQPGGDCDSLGDTLHSLLSPVVNVIWSVKFHPYVSAVKAETAMAFLVTLAEECQILEGNNCISFTYISLGCLNEYLAIDSGGYVSE